MKSLLSKKDQQLHDAAKVQKLRRIAVRASKRADWYLELAEQEARLRETAESEEEQVRLSEHIAELLADVPKYRERALTAANEMLHIAQHSDDLDLRRKARSIR
jgi:hypothetical protein